MAGGRFLSVRSFLGLELHEAITGSFDGLAHAPSDRHRVANASGGVHVGVAATRCGESRQGEDDRDRRDDAGSQRGVAQYRGWRDTGEGYEEFLTRLAQASGIPTRHARGRGAPRSPAEAQDSGSNDDWQHPYDPDAKITKMKDGRTHLAHKAEHAVDLETGAVVAVTVQDANEGDTTTSRETLIDAAEKIEMVVSMAMVSKRSSGTRAITAIRRSWISKRVGLRSYISEPDRGRRRIGRSTPRLATLVYRNRRRIRAERGKRLLRQRGERTGRDRLAHLSETGRMRRVHLRGHGNILKRVLLHACALNLGLLMRTLCGVGTPRSLQGCATMLLDTLQALIRLVLKVLWPVIATLCLPSTCLGHRLAHRDDRRLHVSVVDRFQPRVLLGLNLELEA